MSKRLQAFVMLSAVLFQTARPVGGQDVGHPLTCNCGRSQHSQVSFTHSAKRPRVFLPEQRFIDVRDPSRPPAGLPNLPPPPTVYAQGNRQNIHLSLDEAIQIALLNSEVIRFLAGVGASSSGQTIYDVAISNTTIDEEQARFDPFFDWQNSFNRFEPPATVIDPADPNGAGFAGIRTDDYNSSANLSKATMTGGQVNFGVNTNPARFRPGLFALSPQNRHSVDLSFTQPLYRGGGIAANRAPIVVARINTERSFFQYKDSVQELVRGVVAGYWALVAARTDRWARQQQVKQAQFAYDQADARFRAQVVSRGVVAQARVSLGNFKSTLISAANNVLQREAALRALLGLPPADGNELVPVTPPSSEQIELDWYALLALAEQNRPDLIELKLVTEADEQLLLLARNQTHPTIDATALYRWNGLEGKTPTGTRISTSGGQFTDWSLGVNFSVPLGLRRERAALRRNELIVARDRANLRQGIHNMAHTLAGNLRNLDQFYEQYREFAAIREDAKLNLQERRGRWRAGGVGGVSYVDFLLAITDWGNTISAEAQAFAQYNTELANIERESGTILESHGIRFFEERHAAIGPLGRIAHKKHYPATMPPTSNASRYRTGDEPAENFFDLEDPLLIQPEVEPLPPGTPQSRANSGGADNVPE